MSRFFIWLEVMEDRLFLRQLILSTSTLISNEAIDTTVPIYMKMLYTKSFLIPVSFLLNFTKRTV